MNECECNEDTGPCEDHSILVISRDGASSHSGDYLNELMIHDAISLGVEWETAEDQMFVEGLDYDSAWLTNPDDSEILSEIADEYASRIYDLAVVEGHPEIDSPGWWVHQEDGYTIQAITGGPLLEEV